MRGKMPALAQDNLHRVSTILHEAPRGRIKTLEQEGVSAHGRQ